MDINKIILEQNMTKYSLAKKSGLPQTTVLDICSGKTKISKCSGETLYKLAKALGVSMEILVADSMEYRSQFETFKSNTCHFLKDLGDVGFLTKVMESDQIRKFYEKGWYPECLYLLGMVDYVCREKNLPICNEYADIRKMKLKEILYPVGIQILSAAAGNNEPKTKSLNEAIPEFLRFNIVENEVRNVF